VKRDWVGLFATICFAIALLLSAHRSEQHERRIIELEHRVALARVRAEQESERADEAESRLSWRIHELERLDRDRRAE